VKRARAAIEEEKEKQQQQQQQQRQQREKEREKERRKRRKKEIDEERRQLACGRCVFLALNISSGERNSVECRKETYTAGEYK